MPEEPEESLAEAFRAVARQLRRQTQRALAPFDVTPSQARVLGVLARHGPMRLGALSEYLRIAARSATDVVDALEDARLVERRPDPADRRAKLIVLTKRGREAVAAGRQTVEGLEDQVTEILGERGHRELRRLLSKLLDSTDA